METIKVDILNPKARELLDDLAKQNMIAIRETSKSGFSEVLKKLRSQSSSVPEPDEIVREVEDVRSKRYNN